MNLEQYRNEANLNINQLKSKQNRNILFALLVLMMFLLSLYTYLRTFSTISGSLVILSLVLFVLIAYLNGKINEHIKKWLYQINIIDEYEQLQQLSLSSNHDAGEAFCNQNPILEDLDLIGEHSLFQYLNRARTKGGKEKLIQRFFNTENDLDLHHEAIDELTSKPGLMIKVQAALSEYKEIDLDRLLSHVKGEKKSIKGLMVFDIIFDILSIACLVACIANVIKFSVLLICILARNVMASVYRRIYGDCFDKVERSITLINLLYEPMQMVIQEEFEAKLLINIQKDLVYGQKAFEKFRKLDTLESYAKNLISEIIMNSFCSLNLIILYQYNQLQDETLNECETACHAFENLEVLFSLSTIPMTRNDYCVPVVSKKIALSFDSLKHPLYLDFEPNSFESHGNVHLITGSNMSGKTSFMRMIGMNLILMNAGTYAIGKRLEAPIYSIYTSMRIRDDLSRGISTFYMELLRIKDCLSALEAQKPMLILIDEIFKGTNYNDRITGAKAVIQRLNQPYVQLFISTHDFELCDLEAVDNYYFSEYYDENGIQFDYKIKEGKCPTTNAIYLMKKLVFIDEDDENE